MNTLPAPIRISDGKPLDRATETGLSVRDWNTALVLLNFVETQLWSMYVETDGGIDEYVFTYGCPYHTHALKELTAYQMVEAVRRNQVPWKKGSYVEGGSTPNQKRELGQAYKLLYRIPDRNERTEKK